MEFRVLAAGRWRTGQDCGAVGTSLSGKSPKAETSWPGVVSGGIATSIKNENHSTFSPGVAVAAVTQQPEINKGISADSAGSTPSSFKGMTGVTKIMSMSWLSEKDFRHDYIYIFFFYKRVIFFLLILKVKKRITMCRRRRRQRKRVLK